MGRVAVLLSTSQPILDRIVTSALGDEPTVEVVRTVSGVGELMGAMAERDRTVAVVDVGAQAPEDVARCLHAAYPRVKLVLLSENGRSAHTSELRAHYVALDDVSPTTIRQAVRELAEADD